jgi:hypothetical protein
MLKVYSLAQFDCLSQDGKSTFLIFQGLEKLEAVEDIIVQVIVKLSETDAVE